MVHLQRRSSLTGRSAPSETYRSISKILVSSPTLLRSSQNFRENVNGSLDALGKFVSTEKCRSWFSLDNSTGFWLVCLAKWRALYMNISPGPILCPLNGLVPWREVSQRRHSLSPSPPLSRFLISEPVAWPKTRTVTLVASHADVLRRLLSFLPERLKTSAWEAITLVSCNRISPLSKPMRFWVIKWNRPRARENAVSKFQRGY